MRRIVVILLWLAAIPRLLAVAPEYPRMGADIFDPKAPAEELIAAALTRAEREHKRVLLFFGANWCPWCRRLHRVFAAHEDIVSLLNQGFVLVHVDANTRRDKKRNASALARYGNPQRSGLPVFVVLASDGAQLATQETQSLAAPTDPEVVERLRRFLRDWLPPEEPGS